MFKFAQSLAHHLAGGRHRNRIVKLDLARTFVRAQAGARMGLQFLRQFYGGFEARASLHERLHHFTANRIGAAQQESESGIAHAPEHSVTA